MSASSGREETVTDGGGRSTGITHDSLADGKPGSPVLGPENRDVFAPGISQLADTRQTLRLGSQLPSVTSLVRIGSTKALMITCAVVTSSGMPTSPAIRR